MTLAGFNKWVSPTHFAADLQWFSPPDKPVVSWPYTVSVEMFRQKGTWNEKTLFRDATSSMNCPWPLSASVKSWKRGLFQRVSFRKDPWPASPRTCPAEDQLRMPPTPWFSLPLSLLQPWLPFCEQDRSPRLIGVFDLSAHASCRKPMNVIPAKAGIHGLQDFLDPSFRRGDVRSTTLPPHADRFDRPYPSNIPLEHPILPVCGWIRSPARRFEIACARFI